MWDSAHAENNTKAISFFDRFGFVEADATPHDRAESSCLTLGLGAGGTAQGKATGCADRCRQIPSSNPQTSRVQVSNQTASGRLDNHGLFYGSWWSSTPHTRHWCRGRECLGSNLMFGAYRLMSRRDSRSSTLSSSASLSPPLSSMRHSSPHPSSSRPPKSYLASYQPLEEKLLFWRPPDPVRMWL